MRRIWTEKPRCILRLTLLILIASLYGSSLNAQTASNSDWLPQTHEERLRLILEQVAAHASTRSNCNQVLEAKLSDNSPTAEALS